MVQFQYFQLKGSVVGDVEGIPESELSLIIAAFSQTDFPGVGGAVLEHG